MAAGATRICSWRDRSEHELQFVFVDLTPYALSAAALCADYTPARDCRALAVHELVPRDLRDRAVARAGVHLPADDAYLVHGRPALVPRGVDVLASRGPRDCGGDRRVTRAGTPKAGLTKNHTMDTKDTKDTKDVKVRISPLCP